MKGESDNRIEFLATALAGPEHRRTAAGLALLSVLICALLAPFAALPGPVIPAFIPGYESALIIGDGITALLLLGQFRELRRPSLLVLGCGYLFTALTVVVHMLSFPGLIDAAGLIGGLQTTVWLYVFWHALFPLFVVGYAVLARAPPSIEPSFRWSRNALAIGAGVCTVSLLVSGCVLLTTAGHGLLPTLMDGDQYRPGVTRPALAVPWAVTLLALAVLVWKTRLRRVLDLWLAIALGAWLIEILLSALLNSGRYQLGFYAGRLYGLFAANVVLAMLLMETISLYGRLARSLAEARIQADELARAQTSLQQMQRLEAVGQLTGGIAHDFNNLLTVITASLELLLQKADEPARVRRFAETALGGAERGRRLTQQLLTFARRQVTRPETVNPNRLITELAPLLRRGAGEQVEIVTDLSPVLDPVNIDTAEFEAALLNLVINARDAMEGSGRVTIGTGNTELTSTDLAESPEAVPGRYVLITVSDNGSGIPAEVLTKVFDPFFTTKEPGRGSGLGLSQVYGFVKSAGGHVRIDSTVGAGTTVRLYLPRSAERPRMMDTPSQIAPLAPARGQEAVLIVEDDAEVLAMAVENVQALGYRVLTAVDANRALDILRGEEPVDLLFSDVVMPGDMNGVQLAIEARRLRPRLKILLTSGYTAAALSRERGLPGDLEFLSKPYRRDELAGKLRVIAGGA